jgi:hypothetical protein
MNPKRAGSHKLCFGHSRIVEGLQQFNAEVVGGESKRHGEAVSHHRASCCLLILHLGRSGSCCLLLLRYFGDDCFGGQ